MPKQQLTAATKPVVEPKVPAPQTKRDDEVFKRQAVEYWIQSGQPDTPIAAEPGLSYPSLKAWTRHSGARRSGGGEPRPQKRTGPGARAARPLKKKR